MPTPDTFATIKPLDEQFLMPVYARYPGLYVRGEGCYLFDDEGNRYLDLLAGVAVCQLGHCHPAVAKAIAEQATTLMHSSNVLLSPPVAKLGAKLCELSGMEKVFFGVCGATANETSLKIAKAHGLVKRPNWDYEIVSLHNSFHGRTIGVLSVTGRPHYRTPFEPLIPNVKFVRANDVDELRSVFSEKTAAMILEPVQGEAGVTPMTTEFLQEARRLCDEHDALLMVDEVQSGMGRTGTWFHFQQHGIMPDVMALAKGLGSGMPIGACLARGKAATYLGAGSHGSTFGGNALMCAAGLAVIDTIERERILDHVREVGPYFMDNLRRLGGPVVEVRGAGLMIGVVLDRPIAYDIVRAALKKGLILNATSDRMLRIIPALILTKEQIDEAVGIMGSVLAEMGVAGAV